MKKPVQFNVTLIAIAISIFSLSSCEPKYAVKFTSFDKSTISTNPLIKWQIYPTPEHEFIATIKMVQMNEEESIESALKREGFTVELKNAYCYKYLGQPQLEPNAQYAIQVSIHGDALAPFPQGSLTTADGKTVIFRAPFAINLSTNADDSRYIIDFTPNYANHMGDTVDWQLIRVPACVQDFVNPYVDEHGNEVIPKYCCQWTKANIAYDAVMEANNNAGNRFPNPAIAQSGKYIISNNGPHTISPTLHPAYRINNDPHTFLLHLRSRKSGLFKIYYILSIIPMYIIGIFLYRMEHGKTTT